MPGADKFSIQNGGELTWAHSKKESGCHGVNHEINKEVKGLVGFH